MSLGVLSYLAMNLAFLTLKEETALTHEGQSIVVSLLNASQTFDIPVELLISVMYAESRYNLNADSGVATGLMQMHKRFQNQVAFEFREKYGFRLSFYEIRHQNVMLGAYYLREMYDKYKSWAMALVAYNCGPGHVDAGEIPSSSIAYAKSVIAGAQWNRFSREVYPLFLQSFLVQSYTVDSCYRLAWGSAYPARKPNNVSFYFGG